MMMFLQCHDCKLHIQTHTHSIISTKNCSDFWIFRKFTQRDICMCIACASLYIHTYVCVYCKGWSGLVSGLVSCTILSVSSKQCDAHPSMIKCLHHLVPASEPGPGLSVSTVECESWNKLVQILTLNHLNCLYKLSQKIRPKDFILHTKPGKISKKHGISSTKVFFNFKSIWNFGPILINVTVNAGHNTKSKGKLEIICHQFQKNLNSVSRGVELTRKILRSTRVSWHLSHVRNFFDFENVEYASIYIHSPL